MDFLEDNSVTIKTLASLKDTTVEGLAKMADINASHLKSVSLGRAAMTAYDLRQLHLVTKVPYEKIKID